MLVGQIGNVPNAFCSGKRTHRRSEKITNIVVQRSTDGSILAALFMQENYSSLNLQGKYS